MPEEKVYLKPSELCNKYPDYGYSPQDIGRLCNYGLLKFQRYNSNQIEICEISFLELQVYRESKKEKTATLLV